MTSKIDLRADLQKRRQVFVKKRKSSLINLPSQLWSRLSVDLQNFQSIAGYVSLRGEPDIMSLLSQVAVGKRTGLPFLDESGAVMTFRSWSPGEALEKSSFGFCQPSPDAALFIPDAIFVPLVGFDRALNRLGHGKGHYDRALASLPRAFKIGIGWSVQEAAAIPADPWDVLLDAVLTEREWIERG